MRNTEGNLELCEKRINDFLTVCTDTLWNATVRMKSWYVWIRHMRFTSLIFNIVITNRSSYLVTFVKYVYTAAIHLLGPRLGYIVTENC